MNDQDYSGDKPHLITILGADPYDDRDGPYFSKTDLKYMRRLPVGTKLTIWRGSTVTPGCADADLVAAAPAPTVSELDEIAEQIEKFGQAYAEDIFAPVGKEDRDWLHKARPGLQDRIAADMGRHFGKLACKWAAALRAAPAPTVSGECCRGLAPIDECKCVRPSPTRAEVLEEAAKIADAWTRPDALRLAAGEMTAQEMRTARAVARGIAAAIRALAGEKP